MLVVTEVKNVRVSSKVISATSPRSVREAADVSGRITLPDVPDVDNNSPDHPITTFCLHLGSCFDLAPRPTIEVRTSAISSSRYMPLTQTNSPPHPPEIPSAQTSSRPFPLIQPKPLHSACRYPSHLAQRTHFHSAWRNPA